MTPDEQQHRADDDVPAARGTQSEEPPPSPAAPIARMLANPRRTRRA
ncbi:hypothetical protein [Geodermatophilus sp. Leaf369]|nr:hypothetical protein [Geodermatophilus sp. Leaf369]